MLNPVKSRKPVSVSNLLTLRQAAQSLKVNRELVRILVRTHEIPTQTIGRAAVLAPQSYRQLERKIRHYQNAV
jgi:aminoglycoside phosphotransferase (APT) family kinase protein